jgi:hypothetical protein
MQHIRRRYVWDRLRGRLYPVPMGAEGEGDPPGGGGEPPKNIAGDEPLQLTQSQLNAMMTREKNQGRQAAQQELADQLGVPLEEAKSILTAARERSDAEKTEAQRAKEAADAEKAQAAQDREAAARERYETRVERALIRAGVSPDDSSRLADLARLVTSPRDADLDAISEDVKTVKERYPELFGETSGGPKPLPSSDPKGGPPRRRGTEDAMARGAERAKRHGRRGVQYDPVKTGL